MKLEELTDEQLRAEARRRGFELHSLQFSQAAQNALRELEGLRRRDRRAPHSAERILGIGLTPARAINA